MRILLKGTRVGEISAYSTDGKVLTMLLTGPLGIYDINKRIKARAYSTPQRAIDRLEAKGLISTTKVIGGKGHTVRECKLTKEGREQAIVFKILDECVHNREALRSFRRIRDKKSLLSFMSAVFDAVESRYKNEVEPNAAAFLSTLTSISVAMAIHNAYAHALIGKHSVKADFITPG